MRRMTLRLLAAAAGMVIWGAGAAKANTIQLISTGVTIGSPNSTYHFELELTPNNGLTGATPFESGLIILDFPGFSSATLASNAGGEVTASGNWALASSSTGGSPLDNQSFSGGMETLFANVGGDHVSAIDGTATNIVLMYTGLGVATTGTQRNLIGLDVVAAAGLDGGTVIETLSRDTVNSVVQVETFPTTIAVPVPAAAWMGLSTLGGLGVMGVLRRRK